MLAVPRLARRIALAGEIIVWSLAARVLVRLTRTERAIQLLNLLPRRRRPARGVALPPESSFRLAGACLGRSLARSQFLRRRGQPHTLVLGVRGGIERFAAHAWLEPYDVELVSSDFIDVWRVER